MTKRAATAALEKSTGIPGMAVVIVHGGKTLYASGFGVMNQLGPLTR